MKALVAVVLLLVAWWFMERQIRGVNRHFEEQDRKFRRDEDERTDVNP